ncbi:MAG TPA: hypothetical protein VIG33_18255 [Pseudobdellovibrionaceae bacterium]
MKDKENPVILVYRRTHTGDPNDGDGGGIFGFNDCMKSVRDWEYDAVIGIGGSKPDRGYEKIKEKITWIGICPKKHLVTQEDKERMKVNNPEFEDFGGRMVTFDRFLFLDKPVSDDCPELYKHMFEEGKIPHQAKNFDKYPMIYNELKAILKLADDAPQSPARDILGTANPVGPTYSSSKGTQKNKGCA